MLKCSSLSVVFLIPHKRDLWQLNTALVRKVTSLLARFVNLPRLLTTVTPQKKVRAGEKEKS